MAGICVNYHNRAYIFLKNIAVYIYKSFKSEIIKHIFYLRHLLKLHPLYFPKNRNTNMQTKLPLPICTFFLWKFLSLLWLGVDGGRVFFIQIQLDIEGV